MWMAMVWLRAMLVSPSTKSVGSFGDLVEWRTVTPSPTYALERLVQDARLYSVPPRPRPMMSRHGEGRT